MYSPLENEQHSLRKNNALNALTLMKQNICVKNLDVNALNVVFRKRGELYPTLEDGTNAKTVARVSRFQVIRLLDDGARSLPRCLTHDPKCGEIIDFVLSRKMPPFRKTCRAIGGRKSGYFASIIFSRGQPPRILLLHFHDHHPRLLFFYSRQCFPYPKNR